MRACVDCASTGRIEFRRCRSTWYGQEHLDVVRSVAMLEHGVLPVSGGWTDQAAPWVDAVSVVQSEIEDYRRAAEKEASKRDH